MTTLILRLIPVYSKTAPIIKYHPYFSHSQITPGLLPILRLLSDFSHSQITPIPLHFDRWPQDYSQTNSNLKWLPNYSHSQMTSKLLTYFQNTPRLLPDWSNSQTTHLFSDYPRLLLDRFNSHITAELLPFSDDFQTTPYSLINPRLLPIIRWIPSYSLFSDYSKTTPNSQMTPRPLFFLRLLPLSITLLGKGSKIKKNKSREFSLFPRPPPARGGKVGNLFMIFFQHPRVKFALFFDATHNIWNLRKRGTMVFKLNIFQRIFGY